VQGKEPLVHTEVDDGRRNEEDISFSVRESNFCIEIKID
jgi:hypothetical protein